jgi:hypothetical protein
MFKKLIKELHGLAWTLAGTGLVLITLSGQVQSYALAISVSALIVHIGGVIVKKDD